MPMADDDFDKHLREGLEGALQEEDLMMLFKIRELSSEWGDRTDITVTAPDLDAALANTLGWPVWATIAAVVELIRPWVDTAKARWRDADKAELRQEIGRFVEVLQAAVDRDEGPARPRELRVAELIPRLQRVTAGESSGPTALLLLLQGVALLDDERGKRLVACSLLDGLVKPEPCDCQHMREHEDDAPAEGS